MSDEFNSLAEDARIATLMGGVRACDLWEGDLVQTLDAGPQPVVGIRRCVVRGHGADAPVLFASGAIGNHSPLKMSQQHRVLIASPLAELMFGAAEVLVPAKALVNGEDICLIPCAQVAYVQLVLKRHEILLAEGALCESHLPPATGTGRDDRALPLSWRAARPVLSYGEAVALLGARPSLPPDLGERGAASAMV